MAIPIEVLVIYLALIVWAALLVRALLVRSFRAFLLFGVALMLYLNIGYVLNGVPASIASFVGIYDVLINIGLVSASNAAAISTCPDNNCTVWGEIYTNHPAWGAAFYERFANGPELRSALLMGHIIFNSIVFVLMHVQLMRTGFGPGKSMHKLLGRVSFISLTISLICAVWLASEHGLVAEYGGLWAEWGFYFMTACVYGCAVMSVIAIRSGNSSNHRVWTIRFVGSMWGAFWMFRVILFVIDPLLRNYEAAAILIVIWGSAPLGIVVAELIRRKTNWLAGRKTSEQIPAE